MNEKIAYMLIDHAIILNREGHLFDDDEVSEIMLAIDFIETSKREQRKKYRKILKGDSRPYETI